MNYEELKVLKYSLKNSQIKTDGFLTKMEEKILLSRIKGFTVEKIATDIYVRPRTVTGHIKRIKEKFEVTQESSAIACCFLSGYIKRNLL